MATTFSIKRGYINGNNIFIAKFKEKTYKNIDELDKLSDEVTGIQDFNGAGGIFNPNASFIMKYGAETKNFTFDALDLFTDDPANIKSKMIARFVAFNQWKNEMNTFEEFDLQF